MYIHLIRDISVMTVGAVSLYQYSTSYNYDTTSQYKYFGMVVSDERLQQLMVKYGIIETGDSKNDLDALYKAMYPNAVTQATTAAQASQTKQAAPQTKTAETNGATATIPWANLMAQVGLVPTGDLATDYVAFGNKLSVMQASATTQDQKANIGLLQAEAAIVFTPPTNATTALASSSAPQSQAQAPSRVSGADIQAQLNKLYLMF